MERSKILRLGPEPIDVVGDVHGHLDPLRQLMRLMGYDAAGRHPEGRRLLFVGDLCDRGPDSPGVFELVMRAVEDGGALCLLGNHEQALIDPDENERQKAGNAWFFGNEARCRKDEQDFGPFRRVRGDQRERIEAFCDGLPIAVEHPDVQVVHACWDPASLEFVRSVGSTSNREIIAASNARAVHRLEEAGLEARFPVAKAALEDRRRMRDWAPDHGVTVEEQLLIDDLVPGEHIEQRENPIRVLTSGPEWPARSPMWLGKKWRFLERLAWWQSHPVDRPTVFGHYWRQREHLAMKPYDEHARLFDETGPGEWLGPGRLALCIDYRWPGDWSRASLAAYRPDLAELLFWDGERVASRWG
jgi:hypothetical protein